MRAYRQALSLSWGTAGGVPTDEAYRESPMPSIASDAGSGCSGDDGLRSAGILASVTGPRPTVQRHA